MTRWLALSALLMGCASSTSSTRDGGSDAGTGDAGVLDAGGRPDVPAMRVDAGPEPAGTAQTCEPCEVDADCTERGYCVRLTVGGRACAPGCNPDLPDCPRAFGCVLDLESGATVPVCLPIGGACCIDEDADGYGRGVGCSGTDCDDGDPAVSPGAAELCNGRDDDCDATPDDPPTDCEGERCEARSDGTFEATSASACEMGACTSGTLTSCGLFTCNAAGSACGASCAVAGADDDAGCIAAAHCDGGACVADAADGEACDEDGDCTSAHCEGGICCASGECCRTIADCGTGSGVGAVCDSPTTCQGTRGDLSCDANVCVATTGIADDSACDATVRALDCAPWLPVHCTGGVDQPPPSCPTSCASDAECIASAHCETGVCAPDRGPGGACARAGECRDGLTCAGGVCCDRACSGGCESCVLPATRGTCVVLDDPTDTVSCGMGACARTVQRCLSGREQMCVPGTAGTETCNGADDDCDSMVDEGAGALCPGGLCTAGSCGLATSCLDLHRRDPLLPSGAYEIDPDGPGGRAPFAVYCDMTTGGGGWTYGTIVRTTTDTAMRTRVAGVTTFGAPGGTVDASEYSVDLTGIVFTEVRIDNFTAARFVQRMAAAPITWDATTYTSSFGFTAKRVALAGGWELRVGYYSDYCALRDVNLSVCFVPDTNPVSWVCDSDSMPIQGWLDNTGGELCTSPPGNYCRKWWYDGTCTSYSATEARYGFAVR